jgi:hypothetical protein
VLDDGAPTLVLYSNWERQNYLVSYFAGALNRDLNVTQPTFDSIYYLGPIMGAGNRSQDRVKLADDVELEHLIVAGGAHHLRVIVADRNLDAMLRSYAAAHPGLDLTVIYMPQLRAFAAR